MSTIVKPSGRRVSSRVSWWVMAVMAVGLAVMVVPRYLGFDADRTPLELNPDQPTHIVWLSLHAISGGLALVVGPFQFRPAIRRDRPGLHRALGRVYVAAVIAGSATGLVSVLMSTSGPVAQSGLLLLVALWFASVCMAVRAIRAGQVRLHRVWMIRNYALTFGAVTLRVLIAVGMLYRAASRGAVTPEQVYEIAIWGSIALMVVVAEWLILPAIGAERGRAVAARQGAAGI